MNLLSVIFLLFAFFLLITLRKRILWFHRNFISQLITKIINSIRTVVNYAVVYFKLYVLMQTEQQAYKEHYSEYYAGKVFKKRKRELPNIAVINKNLDKYTETFIQRHIIGLSESGYFIHRLYGGDLPTSELLTGHLNSASEAYRKYLAWKEFFFDKGVNYYLRRAVKKYLKNNNIKLVIAEFGTCGAEVYGLCKELNIPLIVIFHGYDAHHNDIITSYAKKYNKMFEYASVIVCVSNDIVSRLKNMGAPEEKLFYLPCSYDAAVFKYSDHSKNKQIFLSVGRFCETKSPHVTLLAFAVVLKKIPEAKLIIIGKDGGGELFEACHILVKALKIENSVIFKGILPIEEVYEQMQKARVFVQHSVTTPLHDDKEGTPVSIVEAMACGLPIVATLHAGIAEIIRNNFSGVLVEEYDYMQMAEEMIRICEDDKLVYSLGKNAAEAIRSNEYFSKNIEKLAELIEKNRIN